MNLSEKARAAVRELDEALFPSGIYCLCCGSMTDRTRMYSLCDDCIEQDSVDSYVDAKKYGY